jgi:hypothetical protein
LLILPGAIGNFKNAIKIIEMNLYYKEENTDKAIGYVLKEIGQKEG